KPARPPTVVEGVLLTLTPRLHVLVAELQAARWTDLVGWLPIRPGWPAEVISADRAEIVSSHDVQHPTSRLETPGANRMRVALGPPCRCVPADPSRIGTSAQPVGLPDGANPDDAMEAVAAGEQRARPGRLRGRGAGRPSRRPSGRAQTRTP